MDNNDIFVKTFEMMVKNCQDNNIMIPSYCFKNNDDKIRYVVKVYFEDKKEYLKTGVWPAKQFLQRDMIWEYYYYLKISDCTLKLDNYLDFNYDTTTWTRKEIENAVNKYGKKVLFPLAIYLELKPGIPFDEWYRKEKESLKPVQDIVDEFNARINKK